MKQIFINSEDHLRSGWKLILFFLAHQITTGMLVIPVALFQILRHRPLEPVLELAGPFLSAIAALAVSAAAVRIEKRPFRSLGFALGRPWFREVGQGLLLGGLLITLSALLLRASGSFHWMPQPAGSLRGIALGFLLFLAVAVNEEVIFRGYPFQGMVNALGPGPTQLILAVAFAALHLRNPGISTASTSLKMIALLNIALAAILLGLCYLRTRSLALPIGVHLGWNWAQGNLLGFGVSGTSIAKGLWVPVLHQKPQWLTGGAVGIEGSIICTLVCGLAVLGLFLWKPKEETSSEAFAPNLSLNSDPACNG